MSSTFITSWSGGKDSCYATYKALAKGYTIKCLLTTLNENGKVSRSHAIPVHILEKQAASIGVPLITIPSTWNEYEQNFIKTLQQAAITYEIDTAVFGDIDIDSNRLWEEKVAAAAKLNAYLPLWQQNRKALVHEMIAIGIEATIVSCNKQLGIPFLGKQLNTTTILQLEQAGVDICGENGEFHTLVTNAPSFKQPVPITITNKYEYEHYCFLEIE